MTSPQTDDLGYTGNPWDGPAPIVPPGKQRLYVAQELSGWGVPMNAAIAEAVTSHVFTPTRTITPSSPKSGAPTGETHRQQTDHRADLATVSEWHTYGVGPFSLFGLLGSSVSGAADTVTAVGSRYKHVANEGLNGTRLNTLQFWHKLGVPTVAGNTLLERAGTPKSVRLTSAAGFLTGSYGYESLWPLTSEDPGYVDIPGTLQYISGGANGTDLPITRTTGLRALFGWYGSNGQAYTTQISGVDLNIARSLSARFNRAGNSGILPAAPANGTAAAAEAGSGSGPANGTYKFAFAYFDSRYGTWGPLSPLNIVSGTVAAAHPLNLSNLPAIGSNGGLGIFRTKAADAGTDPSHYYFVGAITTGTVFTDSAIDAALTTNLAYTNYSTVPFKFDPLNPTDIVPGFLTATLAGTIEFDGHHTGTPGRDFLDYSEVGSASLTHFVRWTDADGNSLQIDLGPGEIETEPITETPELVTAVMNLNCHPDEGVLFGSSPAMSLVKVTLINGRVNPYIY